MRTILASKTLTLHKYGELESSARDKAHSDWLAVDGEYFWAKENRETLDEFCKMFDIKVSNFEYGSAGAPWIRWQLPETYGPEQVFELSGTRLLKYLINQWGDHFWKPRFLADFYREEPVFHRKIRREPPSKTDPRYRHIYESRVLEQFETPNLTGYWLDHEILEPMVRFMKHPAQFKGTTFEDLLGECLEAWVQRCHSDVEYEQSEDNFEEMAEINDWWFKADGTLVNLNDYDEIEVIEDTEAEEGITEEV